MSKRPVTAQEYGEIILRRALVLLKYQAGQTGCTARQWLGVWSQYTVELGFVAGVPEAGVYEIGEAQ